MAKQQNLWTASDVLPSLDVATVTDVTLAAATESAEQDTGLSVGTGILHVWSTETPQNAIYQIALYSTSGNSSGAGLPVTSRWNVIHDDQHAVPPLQERFWIDPTRRYFRVVCTHVDTFQWAFERL